MDEAAIRKLVDKYLDGTCSEEEKNSVEAWYNAFDNRSDAFGILSEDQKEEVREHMLSEIKATIRSHESGRTKYLWFRYVVSAAAVLILFLTFVNNWRSAPPEVVQETAARMITVINKERSIQRVVLSDSSTLWLQPGAEVVYPEHFEKTRTVSMKGDVFFEVQRDVSRPFLVYSAQILTRVLGTSFRVRTMEEEGTATVSVLTGKVSVRRIIGESGKNLQMEENRKKADEVLLLPYERVLFSDRAMVIQKNEPTGRRELEMWRKSTVSFDNVIVKDVLVALSRLFGVQISASSEKINQYLLKADFTGMNLPDILEILESSLDITYEINGDQIVLKPLE